MRTRPPRSRSTPAALLATAPVLLVLPVVAALAGCGPDRSAAVPPGTTWTGDAGRAVELLERLEALEGTPIAETAAGLRRRIAGCERFVAHCPADAEDCSLPERAECGEPDAADRFAELRGEADWIFARGSVDGHGLILRGTASSEGGLTLDGSLFPTDREGPVSLLLPSAEPPGPARLSEAQALIHLRLRPDGGLDVARFVEGGSWGARLYQLQSKLFEGSTLAGVWELAVYTPQPGELIPPMTLALDLKSRELATEAMERFLDDLKQTWPVRRSDFRLGERTGACLSNVRVMPDLAPCYVTSADTLFVGWNPRSLEVALPEGGGDAPAQTASDSSSSGGPSRARLYLDRMPSADAVVAETSGAHAPVPPDFYPWRLVELRGTREQDHYHLEADLLPR